MLATLACLLWTAPAAHAKDGVRATLERPEVLRDARPGDRVAVAWKLADASGHAFGASGIYLRVRDAELGGTRRLPARASGGAGRYVADVTIPGAGIDGVAVGLEGIRTVRGQAPVRADLIFPVVNFPVVDDPLGAPRDDAGQQPAWAALGGAVLLAAAGGATAAAARRRRRRARC